MYLIMCFCNFGSFCPAKIFSKNSVLILFSSNLSVKLESHSRRQGSSLLKCRKQSHSATNLHLHTCSTSPATFIFTFLDFKTSSESNPKPLDWRSRKNLSVPFKTFQCPTSFLSFLSFLHCTTRSLDLRPAAPPSVSAGPGGIRSSESGAAVQIWGRLMENVNCWPFRSLFLSSKIKEMF